MPSKTSNAALAPIVTGSSSPETGNSSVRKVAIRFEWVSIWTSELVPVSAGATRNLANMIPQRKHSVDRSSCSNSHLGQIIECFPVSREAPKKLFPSYHPKYYAMQKRCPFHSTRSRRTLWGPLPGSNNFHSCGCAWVVSYLVFRHHLLILVRTYWRWLWAEIQPTSVRAAAKCQP